MKINFLVPVISFSILSAITSRCESLFMFNKRGYEVVTSSKSAQKDSRTKFMPRKQIQCSESTKETLTIRRPQRRHWLVPYLLTLNVYYIFFKSFYSWLRIGKCLLGSWRYSVFTIDFKKIYSLWKNNFLDLFKVI